MKISLNWLSDYVDVNTDPMELAAILTRAGIEVEEIDSSATVPAGVVTAKILSRDPHPNSDHLSICEVDPGNGEPVQIVCGAPNCDAGNIVPLATLGTVFKDPDGGKDFVIKPSKLRGVESFGMMCSARELGLSNDHDGLMIFPADTALGQAVDKMYPGETIFNLELTQNRPDWLSHWGIARDVSALCDGILRFPDISLPDPEVTESFENLVKVEAADLCPKYTARVIKGVKVGPSPDWLKNRLESVGIRSIDNIVDITNYVMLELGVPLHVFDRALLDGGIVVRRAAAGESITALDGKKYDLKPDMLVIADEKKPVAIAGVMGGEFSGVRPETTEVVLEAAYFDKSSIRFTSAALNLKSDASHRYERGVDPEMVEKASARAAKLILELAGGELVSPLVSVAANYAKPQEFRCRYQKIRSLLGMEISDLELASIFSKLGIEVNPLRDGEALVLPPSYRADVKEEADLAEEAARIYGLDKIPEIPVKAIQAQKFSEDTFAPTDRVRTALVSCGLFECVCGSMIGEKEALQDTRFAAEDLLKPVNPISSELAIMRPSLLAGMLDVVRRNISRRNLNLALFEIGRVFSANKEKFPEERDELMIAMTGIRHPERFSAELKETYDFYDLKGCLEGMLEILGVVKYTVKAAQDSRFCNGECAELFFGKQSVGFFGRAADKLTKGMRLQTPLYMAVLSMNALLNAARKPEEYQKLSPFPGTTRDVAFLAPLEMENAKALDFIRRAGVKNLVDVQLFDIFVDDTMAGRKSMAYTLTFRSPEKTLTDEEVNQAHEKLRVKLERGLGVELR